MKTEDKLLQECLLYFKERPVFKKLFEKVKEKYAGLGRLGGSFLLTGLSAQDKMALGGFFQKDYTDNKTVTISMTAMEKALRGTRFAKLSWEEILTAYFGGNLISRKEELQWQEEEKGRYFQRILESAPEMEVWSVSHWLEHVLREKAEGYSFLMMRYRENKEELRKLLDIFFQCVPELPAVRKTEYQLLAVFAAKTTGNPHFFDEGTDGEKLLLLFLREHLRLEAEDTLTRMEKKNRLLYEAGLLRDDLSNDTLVYGICAYDKNGNLHEGIQGFLKQKEPVKLTLLSIGKLASADCQGEHCVYVVENPAVFSILVDKYPERTFLCGNGQPRFATLVLMDLLKENNIFYYAGDFDPEGLLIAQRLKERYQDRLSFWNYDVKCYHEAMSEVVLDESRLSQLQKINQAELNKIKEALLLHKRAAYQEKMEALGAYQIPEKEQI